MKFKFDPKKISTVFDAAFTQYEIGDYDQCGRELYKVFAEHSQEEIDEVFSQEHIERFHSFACVADIMYHRQILLMIHDVGLFIDPVKSLCRNFYKKLIKFSLEENEFFLDEFERTFNQEFPIDSVEKIDDCGFLIFNPHLLANKMGMLDVEFIRKSMDFEGASHSIRIH